MNSDIQHLARTCIRECGQFPSDEAVARAQVYAMASVAVAIDRQNELLETQNEILDDKL